VKKAFVAATMVEDEEEALTELVNGNKDIEFKNGGAKVHCISTGHEMAPRLDTVRSYISGAKYRKARDWYSFDFAQFAPNIIAHKSLKKHLFCVLTGTTLPMNPEKVKAHVGCKRFVELKKIQGAKDDEAAKEAEEKRIRKAKFKAARELKQKEEAAAEGKADGADGKKKKNKLNKKKRKAAADADGKEAGAADATGKKKKKFAARKAARKAGQTEAKADGAKTEGKSGKKRPLRSVLGRRKKQHAEDKK